MLDFVLLYYLYIKIIQLTRDLLYQSGFLWTIPKHTFNATEVFWECFKHSLSLNKRGANGKQRILSIIADKFPYKELQTRLHVNILYYL